MIIMRYIKELFRNKSSHLCNSFWEKISLVKGHSEAAEAKKLLI